VTIEKIEWKGWPNCWRLSNGTVELVVTQDIGPRVIRYGFTGGQNLFKEFTEQIGKSGEASWTIRGGHRLWKGPEDRYATYALDNGPIAVEPITDGVRATQPVEPETGLQKVLTVTLAGDGRVAVTHEIYNRGLLPVEIAAWTPTVMAQGGLGVSGFPPRGTHPECLEPTNPLIMWAFTDLSDPRWKFTNKYLTLRQDPANARPQKLGHWNAHTFGAYFLHGEVFLKEYFPANPASKHPEFGAAFEIFTNADFLELETMGPVTMLAKDEHLTHVEHWSLHRGITLSEISDAALDAALLPLLRQ
jgi:hypothetical protein